MKIVATGASRHMNLGGPSMFHGIVKVLRRFFPNCEIVFLDRSPIATVESEQDPDYPDIPVHYGSPRTRHILFGAWRKKWLGAIGNVPPLERKIVEEIRSADLFINVYGIEFCEKLTPPLNFKGALFDQPLFRVAATLGTKAVHYTASYGPANGRWTRMAARAILEKRCSLVYCRERQSRQNLLNWGVPEKKLVLAPDTGLLMASKPVSLDGLDSQRPRLGISVSHQIIRQWKSPVPYVDIVAQVCDRAIREWNVQVLLIPNELSKVTEYDDRAVAKRVAERMERGNDVQILPAERLSGPQQKGAIAACDLLLASRYHSVVASMSSAVPTLVIGWHHKYPELLGRFNQQNLCLPSEDCNLENVWRRCEKLWNQREQVRAEIGSFITAVEDEIYRAGERLQSLFP